MKILTILIGTLVLNMFDGSNCRADETVVEAMLKAERLGELRLGLLHLSKRTPNLKTTALEFEAV